MTFGSSGIPDRFISADLDGVVFGREDSDALFKLAKIEGWFGGPGVRIDKKERLWGHGSFSERGWRDSRLLIMEGTARFASEDAAAEAYHRLTSMIAEGESATLLVKDSLFGDQWAQVQLANELIIDWNVPHLFTYQVQLLATDPRKYGQTLTASTGVPVDGGGLGYDLYTVGSTGVLDYGAAGTPGTVSLANQGTADTAPVLTVAGSMPNGFTITELGTGQRLVYAGEVIQGQSIRLDSSDGTVMLDGYGDRSVQLIRREWVRLDKGQTGTWLFEAPGSTNALLTVEVVPAWW